MAEYLVDCDPKKIPPQQYKIMFSHFLEEYELQQVQNLLLLDMGNDDHYAVEIKSQDLVHFDSALSFSVLHFPKLLIPLFEEALLELQNKMLKTNTMVHVNQNRQIKQNCHIRVVSLPSIPEISKITISDVKAHEINALIQVTGTVVRTGGVRMLEQSKQYECQNAHCRYRFTVSADPEQDNMLPQPRCCPARAATAGSALESKCNSTNVRELEGGSVCVDYQEIKIQDHLERLSLGSVPRSIVVILLCDLVDRFNPGDDVVVVGTVLRQWRPVNRGARCVVDVAIEANSVTHMGVSQTACRASQSSSEQFEQFWSGRVGDDNKLFLARNDIVRTVCPQLFGMFYVKLSLLLALIGGNSTVYEGGVRRRSQSHMLIVGDPGCGKSQLLRFATSVVPRSILTTGIGTTGAGLTCTAVREGNDWCLEAGALVLSNDGVCCIDEFASIREADRATIHEAMEQQTVSIAKAGLVVKLNTRTTVIACCNPKGSFDASSDLSTNTAIASPLLSRFDLIVVLMDSACKDWDTQVSTFLLMQAVAGETSSSSSSSSRNAADRMDVSSGAMDVVWSLDLLKQYVAFVKANIHPVMTTQARCLLMRHYQLQRQSDDRSSSRTTVRLLESLLRLSEAHAKLMFRNEVTSVDAIVAIHCISLSNPQGVSMLDSVSSVKDVFSSYPAAQFEQVERQVMSMMHYSSESLRRDCAMREDSHLDSLTPQQSPVSLDAVDSVVRESHIRYNEEGDCGDGGTGIDVLALNTFALNGNYIDGNVVNDNMSNKDQSSFSELQDFNNYNQLKRSRLSDEIAIVEPDLAHDSDAYPSKSNTVALQAHVLLLDDEDW